MTKVLNIFQLPVITVQLPVITVQLPVITVQLPVITDSNNNLHFLNKICVGKMCFRSLVLATIEHVDI